MKERLEKIFEKSFKPKIFWMIAPFAIFILLTILVKYGVVHKNIIGFILIIPTLIVPLFFLLPLWIFHKIGITCKVKKWLGDDIVDYIYGYAKFWAFFVLSLWITSICISLIKLGKGIF
ncbi:putative membrane protein [Campylobacter hyointestinalis subsp. lawsonii]|nr:putative membrane protein [Campylobacter hyointestinalis subsp. lawsonii]RAZ27907.1 hypothetical protein CHLT_06225 [Campylobacter hyointestinalis subsp. lawsonii]